jgi:hypothetical protein
LQILMKFFMLPSRKNFRFTFSNISQSPIRITIFIFPKNINF